MLADICVSTDTLEFVAGLIIGLVIVLGVFSFLGRQS
jgi:hypothetical protein